MKTTIQVVENPDRFHVSMNGVPQSTFLHNNSISKAFAEMNAQSEAYKLAARLTSEGFNVKVLKQEIK